MPRKTLVALHVLALSAAVRLSAYAVDPLYRTTCSFPAEYRGYSFTGPQGALAEMRALLLELRPGALAGRKLSELLHQLTAAHNVSGWRTIVNRATASIQSALLPCPLTMRILRKPWWTRLSVMPSM